MSERINSAKDLKVYQKAYSLAMEIFQISKHWPKEEKFALIDQIRRSSRAICSNLQEAWAKRRYEAYFINKLTDSDGENSETETWLDFAKDCEYLPLHEHERLSGQCHEIGSMLGAMIKNPDSFTLKPDK